MNKFFLVGSGDRYGDRVQCGERPGVDWPCNEQDPMGGGNIPDPLTAFNHHMELADDELYLLTGWIQISRTQVYFRVNLAEQRWLANKARAAAPLYPLSGPYAKWVRWDGKPVSLAVRAHQSVDQGRVVIWLEAMQDPNTTGSFIRN